MKNLLLSGILFLTATTFFSCDDAEDFPKIDQFAEIEWQLRYISEDGLGVTAPAVDTTYTITFTTDGGFSVKDDCNACGGDFDLKDGTIEFDGPVCTLRACNTPPPPISFATELANITMVDMIDGELVLSYNTNGNRRALHFRNASDSRPEKVIMADTESFERSDWAGGGYIISEDSLSGDTLFLTIGHSGCGPHEFNMVFYNYFKESNPVQADAILPNIAEACAAFFQVEQEFDLTPLRKAYGDHGTILINFPEPFSGVSSILYEF